MELLFRCFHQDEEPTFAQREPVDDALVKFWNCFVSARSVFQLAAYEVGQMDQTGQARKPVVFSGDRATNAVPTECFQNPSRSRPAPPA